MANGAPGADTFSKLLDRNAPLRGALGHAAQGSGSGNRTWSQSLELVRAYASVCIGLASNAAKPSRSLVQTGQNFIGR